MAHQRVIQEVPRESVVTEARTDVGRAWSPAQIVAVVIGIAFVILGIAALARTGLPVDHMLRPHRDVIGLEHSPLLGAIEIVFGALLIMAGVVAGGARSLMALLGVVSAIFGALVLLDVAPRRLHHWLGAGDTYGWLALAVGVVLLIAAFVAPELAGRSRTRVARRDDVVV